mmetsp:Transcript_63623/g.204991  ORF Transcript_63623/g.204991 Transcript_63623/m.204991 type:complete len:266 (-) Transcript_63623:231-1028(-)
MTSKTQVLVPASCTTLRCVTPTASAGLPATNVAAHLGTTATYAVCTRAPGELCDQLGQGGKRRPLWAGETLSPAPAPLLSVCALTPLQHCPSEQARVNDPAAQGCHDTPREMLHLLLPGVHGHQRVAGLCHWRCLARIPQLHGYLPAARNAPLACSEDHAIGRRELHGAAVLGVLLLGMVANDGSDDAADGACHKEARDAAQRRARGGPRPAVRPSGSSGCVATTAAWACAAAGATSAAAGAAAAYARAPAGACVLTTWPWTGTP